MSTFGMLRHDINDAIVTASSIAAARSMSARRLGYRSAIAGETTAGIPMASGTGRAQIAASIRAMANM